MLITLKCDVSVRHPAGHFEVVKAGSKVNYSNSRNTDTGHMVHRFTCFSCDKHRILLYTEVGIEVPEWL